MLKSQTHFIDFKVIILANVKITEEICGMFQFKGYKFAL